MDLPALEPSDLIAIRAACLADAGIGKISFWDIRHQLEDGSLETIWLDNATPDSLGIWAVVPTRKRIPMRVRLFIDALRDTLADVEVSGLSGR